MKHQILLFSSLISAHLAMANIIVEDTFAGDGALNGRVADVGGTWAANGHWTTTGGNAVFSNDENGMAGISLAPSYFANNPGVYELSATFTITSVGTEWLAIGFSEDINTNDTRGFFNIDGTNGLNSGGRPWFLLRGNEGALIRTGPTDSAELDESFTGFDTTDSVLRLLLDTSVPNWTIDAFIDETQLDLNGASIGSTFTFSTNPTSIHSVGLTANANVIGSVSNFSLTLVPEASTFGLLLGLMITGYVLCHRRVR